MTTQTPTLPPSKRARQAFYTALVLFGAALTGTALLIQPWQSLWQGWLAILMAPNMLVSDAMALGGLGAAMFNCGVMILLAVGLLLCLSCPPSGLALAAVLSVAGFALYGKNPLNSLPLVVGGLLYQRTQKTPAGARGAPLLLMTCLAPLVSSAAHLPGLPRGVAIVLGAGLGVVTGYVLIPLARRTMVMHRGYNLYNMGLAAGFVSVALVSVLRLFGADMQPVTLVSAGGGLWLALGVLTLLLALIAAGWALNGRSFGGYGALLARTGRGGSDYFLDHGPGLCAVNIGLMGLCCYGLALLGGARFDGPVVGTLIMVAGFGAWGKHPRNALPVMLGAFIATVLGAYDPASAKGMIVIFFSAALAPISGAFGPVIGMLAGVLHVALAHQVGYLHAGVNLYNNGFAAGLVAWLMLGAINILGVGKRRDAAPPG